MTRTKFNFINRNVKLKYLILCVLFSIGITFVLTLKDTDVKVEDNKISIKEYELLEEEVEIIRRDAGEIQYKLYLTDKENRRINKENKIFNSILAEIENTESGSKLLKKSWRYRK